MSIFALTETVRTFCAVSEPLDSRLIASAAAIFVETFMVVPSFPNAFEVQYTGGSCAIQGWDFV
jgi:hypothetical protein